MRILKQTSPNTYIASFAGGRFSLTSDIPLKAGSKFAAKIFVSGSRLNLVMTGGAEKNAGVAAENSKAGGPVQLVSTLTPEISELLLSLGIPADTVSKTLMQTLVSLGVKFNLEKLNKARAVAGRFPGRENVAAEAALVLLDKGIEPSFESVQKMLGGFSIDSAVEKNSGSSAQTENDAGGMSEIEAEIKTYFSAVLNGENGNDSAQTDVPGGFLTVFNHCASNANGGGNGSASGVQFHWIVLPFDFAFQQGEKPCEGSGVFRVFFDIGKKNVKKAVINFNLVEKKWTFVVKYNGERLESIRFTHFPDVKRDEASGLEKRLSEFFKGIPVQFELHENVYGFSSEDVPLPLVKGFA